MGVFRQFPYSNFHEMNMDEMIKIIKNMLEEWAQYYAEWNAWMKEMNDDWSNYQEVMNKAWQNMQDFVNNYFDNLDVQNEINNKLSSMATTGELGAIIAPYIPSYVTEWLTAHITQPEGVVIDTSLTVAGACADAKASGDNIAYLKNGVNLFASLFGYNIEQCLWTTGYIDDSNKVVLSDNFRHTTALVDVSTRKYLYINTTIPYTTLFISGYDESETYIANMDLTGSNPHRIPDNIKKITINLYFGSAVSIDTLNHSSILTSTQPRTVLPIEIINTNAELEITNRTKYNYYDLLKYTALESGRFDTNGNKVPTDSQCRTVDKICLPVGTIIDVVATGDISPHKAVIHQYDIDGTYINTTDIDTFDTYDKATFTTTYPYINIAFYTASKTVDEAYTLFNFIVKKPEPTLNGKALTILGDSLSSYNGFSDTDTAYYPKPGLGLDSVSEMYWAIVMNVLNLSLDTVNAYGGSRVTSPDINCISSDERLENLGTPDIILFAAGTNDIYANSPTGVWSGDDLDTLVTTSFIPAYTKCIKYMQTKFPNATIIAISPCFITANAESRLYCTIENLERITEAEKLVCDYTGVKFIDCRKLGMNLSNIANYTVEQLHWNFKFHRLVANEIIKVLTD